MRANTQNRLRRMGHALSNSCAMRTFILPACDDSAAGGSKAIVFSRDMAPGPQPDASVLPPDASPMPVDRRNKLVVQGVPDVSMFRGDRAVLSVRYLNADNQPIANGQVTLSPETPEQALVAIRPHSTDRCQRHSDLRDYSPANGRSYPPDGRGARC